jgi:putative transcriptional regulator
MTKRGGWPPTGFGARLRDLRTEAGLSQRELAERAGCNVFTVNKLERGVQEPAWPLVLALAKALSVSTEEFVSSEPELEEGKLQTTGKKDAKRKRGAGNRKPGS